MDAIRTIIFLIAMGGALTYMLSEQIHLGLYISWLCALIFLYWNGGNE